METDIQLHGDRQTTWRWADNMKTNRQHGNQQTAWKPTDSMETSRQQGDQQADRLQTLTSLTSCGHLLKLQNLQASSGNIFHCISTPWVYSSKLGWCGLLCRICFIPEYKKPKIFLGPKAIISAGDVISEITRHHMSSFHHSSNTSPSFQKNFFVFRCE